jgi:microcystin-dependent protein
MTQIYVGQIIQGGWNFAPSGTALCDGQLLAIQQNTALFSLLGTTYGGNGVSTFQLPNMQGRVPIHWGQSQGTSQYVIGEFAGTENVTLLQANLPLHTHTLSATTSKATSQPPAAGALLAHSVDLAAHGALPAIYYPAGTSPPTVALGGVGVTGGGQPLSILQPYLAITFCISLFGIFPARN